MIMRLFFAILSISVLIACQPKDVRPGMWLNGDLVTQPVSGWSFTDEIEEIFIETNPWYGIPHSTTIWCVAFEGDLYIGSYGQEKKTWEDNLAQDPRARLAISGKLYKVMVRRVTDQQLTEKLDMAYQKKYDMVEVFGNETPEWWFYSVEQRIDPPSVRQ